MTQNPSALSMTSPNAIPLPMPFFSTDQYPSIACILIWFISLKVSGGPLIG